MKFAIRLSVIGMLFLLLGLVSCNNSGNEDDENFVSAYTSTTISGIVYDENNNPKGNVEVKAHGYTTLTGSDGVFLFENITVPKNKCYISVEENGYFSCMRSRKSEIHSVTRMDVHLISFQQGEEFSFQSGNDYTATLTDGSLIKFFASTGFVDQNGNPYTGTVRLNAKALDATSPLYSRYAFGGDQIGLDDNEEQFLDTYTGILAQISKPNGAYLQLAENTTPVEMHQQIPAIFLTKANAPNNIPVYHASLTSGYNKRRGKGSRGGGRYILSVGHFSYWSTQEQTPNYGKIACRVVDNAGNTISGVRVQVGKTYGITGDYGSFEIAVPAGIPMDVAVLPEDFYGISVSSPQVAWSDREERFVELKLPVVLGRVQGQLVDCDNNPIPGQVTLAWETNQSSIYTPSGSFELPTTVSVNETFELKVMTEGKDTTLSFTMESEFMNLGSVKICDEYIPMESSNYVRIDTNGVLMKEYNQFYITSGFLSISEDGQNYSTHISFSGPEGEFNLSIWLCKHEGTYQQEIYGVFNNSHITGAVVNITHYEPVGGRIKGTVEGNLEDPNFDGEKKIYVEFDVVRGEDDNY